MKLAVPLALTVLGLFPAGFLTSCSQQATGFERADADDDQAISLRELSDYATLQAFEEGDTNRDGVLSFAEWRKLAPELDPAVFKRRDLNGDGRISREEALAFTREEKVFEPAFEGLDDDGDGIISGAEARQFLDEEARKQARRES